MTPKEKANQLIRLMTVDMKIDFWQTKQCAIIAVDEILNNDGFTQFDQYLTEFWQEVKQEIEKL
jgi:hypothetical protein